MCGVIGVVGSDCAWKKALEYLEALEYRGYDSAGVATVLDGKLWLEKKVERVPAMRKRLEKEPLPCGKVAVAHTRWATHGKITAENAHPHLDQKKQLAIVHNGIIENFIPLREELQKRGVVFASDTDSEVIAQLLGEKAAGKELTSFIQEFQRMKGSYAVALIHRDYPETLLATADQSPLAVVVNKDYSLSVACSDPQVVDVSEGWIYFLEKGEWALLKWKEAPTFYDRTGRQIQKESTSFSNRQEGITKSGYHHFMLKEIFEQPVSLENTFKKFACPISIKKPKKVWLVACGSSYHAALIGQHFSETIAGIPAEAVVASEFRYSKRIFSLEDLCIFLSQSGETADTLGALRRAQQQHIPCLAVTNTPYSTLDRECGQAIYTDAGKEVAVASTKTLSSQSLTLYLLFSEWGKKTSFSIEELKRSIEKTLELSPQLESWAKRLSTSRDLFCLGRQEFFAVALEAALKIKEIAYVNASAYPSAEMKHGPIALLDDHFPVVMLLPSDEMLIEKTVSNLMECAARGAPIYSLGWKNAAPWMDKTPGKFLVLPETFEALKPIIAIVAVQLLAYFWANEKKLPIDTPKNLAKSVTVE